MSSTMQSGTPEPNERILDELFAAYREARPDFDASPTFGPAMWAKIEAREVSTNWFGNLARALVTAALTASVILGMLVSSMNRQAGASRFFNSTFVEALVADHASALEPLHLDRMAEMDQE